MDDNRTDKTLDALADLFLTGSPRGSAAAAASPLEAPAPIRLPPKARILKAPLADYQGPPRKPDGEDVIGMIGPARPAPMPSQSPRPRVAAHPHLVEAVMMGNLPGFGGPWLSQYAHWLAQRHGPVAVVHLDDDQINVEVVSTQDDPSLPPQRPAPAIHGGAAGGEALLDCLQDLAQLEPSPVRAWLVHLPTPLSDDALAKARQLPRWTVLCGADDAAVVSGYQLLKQLVDGDSRGPQRRVGLMVMGSDMTASRATARRLNDTAGNFLETPVHLIGAIKQMTPLAQRRCGSFTDPNAHWPAVRDFFETLPGKLLTFEDFNKRDMQEPIRVAEPIVAPAATTPTPQKPALVPPVARSVIEPAAPPPQPAVEPVSPAAQKPDLAAYLPGAIALQARCPRHADCQLVLDEDGRVHLLLHCPADRSPRANPDAALNAAVVALMEAQAWVTEHRDLIRMTQRQCQFTDDAPVAHLFTNHAKAAARLASHNASQLRLHLLEQVHLAGQTTWYCTELN